MSAPKRLVVVPSNFVVNEHEGYRSDGSDITWLSVSTVTEENGLSMHLPLKHQESISDENLKTRLLTQHVMRAVEEQISAAIGDIAERRLPKVATIQTHIRISKSGNYEGGQVES